MDPELAEVQLRLEALSHDAQAQVAHRMWQAGLLNKVVSRRWLVGPRDVNWEPVNWGDTHWSTQRLAEMLKRGDDLNDADLFLLGLCVATGIDTMLFGGTIHDVHGYLQYAVTGLHPALRELVYHTKDAVGAAVLSYRT